jgi:hypothetical protein
LSLSLAVVGGVIACAGCSCQGSAAQVVSEAGVEAGNAGVYPRLDASGDGGALSDGGCDPPAVITVPDGGVNPFAVGTWVPPPVCCGNGNLVFAADPNASVKPLQWAPCASQRPGCQHLVVDWKPWNRRAVVYNADEPVRLVQGVAYLVDDRNYSDDGLNLTAYLTVAEKLDGTRVFAAGQFVGSDVAGGEFTSCAVVPAVGERGIVMELSDHPENRSFAWAPWPSLSSFQSVTFSVAALGFVSSQGDVDNMGVGSTMTYLGFGSPPMVVLLNLDLGSFTRTPYSPPVTHPLVVTDGAIVYGNNGNALDFLWPDGTWMPLLTTTPPFVLADFSIDRAAGQQIVWVEADTSSGTCGSAVLWTTPYATTASGVAKRAVAAVNDPLGRCGLHLVANAGAVLTLTGATTAQVTRLSDGMGWVVNAEPGDDFSQPLWVDDNEVWLSTGPASDATNGFRDYSGIFRIARSSLGAPTVPPGL